MVWTQKNAVAVAVHSQAVFLIACPAVSCHTPASLSSLYIVPITSHSANAIQSLSLLAQCRQRYYTYTLYKVSPLIDPQSISEVKFNFSKFFILCFVEFLWCDTTLYRIVSWPRTMCNELGIRLQRTRNGKWCNLNFVLRDFPVVLLVDARHSRMKNAEIETEIFCHLNLWLTLAASMCGWIGYVTCLREMKRSGIWLRRMGPGLDTHLTSINIVLRSDI